MNKNDRFSEILEALIMDHSSHPRNCTKLESCQAQAEGINPLTSDQFVIQFQIVADQIIQVAFSGKGSALATASASIMTGHLKNRSVETAKAAIADVLAQINDDPESTPDLSNDELEVLLEIQQFPHRRNCASFTWRTALSALEKL